MKKQKCSSLLSFEDIVSIFQSGYLYELNSFHYIEKSNQTYDVNRDKSNFLLESKIIYQKYQEGHTLIVKNLDNFNKKIRLKAAELGPETDVHMYLVPPNGDQSFPYHQDTRDVLIHMVYGEKIFWIKHDENETEHKLQMENELFLPIDAEHKAIPVGASCLLSFGLSNKEDYSVPSLFKENDFY